MNEFDTYKLLLVISNISSQYPQGSEFSRKVADITDRMVSHQYRVAVVGEFKRGKSSLINALLGTQLLPTDILPMTAAITKVNYGEKKRIVIRYKSGETEESSVEQLIDYATKIDEQSAERAACIECIRVEYPSVFCKNHIEIIDTPGLNDDEKMTAITLSVLGEIDTAIMVISAQAPMSISEQELVISLIKEQGIHHIFFVVTYIDTVRREVDKDRIIETIKKRISSSLLQRTAQAFENDQRLLEKAERILKEPDVLGVSSYQAMEAFLRDDSELLETSRFPALKKSLLSFLTAAQSTDAYLNTIDAFRFLKMNIGVWTDDRVNELNRISRSLSDFRGRYNAFTENGRKRLFRLFGIMDSRLEEKGFGPGFKEFKDKLRKLFIKNICTIRKNDYGTDRIYEAVKKASEESIALMRDELKRLRNVSEELQEEVYEKFRSECPDIQSEGFSTDFIEYCSRELSEYQKKKLFPEFSWTKSPDTLFRSSQNPDIMPMVMPLINESVERCYNSFEKYLSAWRLVFLHTVRYICNNSDIIGRLDEAERKTELDRYLIRQQYEMQMSKLSEIEKEIRRD